jgi:phage nucleotide-binding protein
MTDLAAKFREDFGVTSPADAIPYINMLLYGYYGVGKTYLGATAQDDKALAPLLIIDVEGGTTTVRHRSDIEVIRASTFNRVVEVWSHLHNMGAKLPWKTVMIDSLTELQKLDMNDIMRGVVNKDPDRDPDVPSQREWGKSSNHMRNIVRRFRDLPCNTIFTALAKEEKDGETGQVTVMPSLPGKLANEVPGFIDIVGYLYTNNETKNGASKITRMLLTQPTRKYKAKDRLAAFGDVVEEPSMPKLWNLIRDKENTYK